MSHGLRGPSTLRLRAVLAAVALLAALEIAPAHAQTPTYPGLEYATLGGTALRLDLYLPPSGSAPRPCVVWIHGGGWQGGSRTGTPPGTARLLASGIAVASVDYRLTGQAGVFGAFPVIFPAQIEDVKGAVRWLRAHATTYGLDPTRFGSWGSSAGGHLSALLGTSAGVAALEGATGGNLAQSSAVQAFADYFGPTDLLRINDMVTTPPGSTINHDAYTSPESKLIGWSQPGQGLGDVKANLANPNAPYPGLVALLQLANPITHLTPDDPPATIAHGTNDTSVPIGQSVALADAMVAAGVSATYRTVVGAGHGALGATTDSLVVEFFRSRWLGPADAPQHQTRSRLSAFPNPARGVVVMTLARAAGAGETIEIFDLGGRHVRRLEPASGATSARWDGADANGIPVPAGVYLVRGPGTVVAGAARIVLVR